MRDCSKPLILSNAGSSKVPPHLLPGKLAFEEAIFCTGRRPQPALLLIIKHRLRIIRASWAKMKFKPAPIQFFQQFSFRDPLFFQVLRMHFALMGLPIEGFTKESSAGMDVKSWPARMG